LVHRRRNNGKSGKGISSRRRVRIRERARWQRDKRVKKLAFGHLIPSPLSLYPIIPFATLTLK